jgi:hypothetical protein
VRSGWWVELNQKIVQKMESKMRLMKYVLPLFALCAFAGVYADPEGTDNERESQGMEDFVDSKRTISIADKGGSLSLSGDVRFEYQRKYEKHNGVKLRGSGSDLAIGRNEFDVDVDLFFDYVADKTWASIWLEFDNAAGVGNGYRAGNFNPAELPAALVAATETIDETVFNGQIKKNNRNIASGECDQVCLRAAYMGYNVFDSCGRLDIEVGRRSMYHVFDSRVQFDSRFDGVVAKYSRSFDCIGDYYSNSAIFIIDTVLDDYGFVSEMGLKNIANKGVDLKYSYIDWTLGGTDRMGRDDTESFQHRMREGRNSQFTVVYHLNPDWLCIDAKVYGAVVVNHSARRRAETNGSKKNLAGYVGASFGRLEKEGDWGIDVNYQWVEAQSIIDSDVSGIGRGNVLKIPFAVSRSYGNVNYHGFLFEAEYAITDNLTAQFEFEFTNELDSALGGKHQYRKAEIELVYGF